MLAKGGVTSARLDAEILLCFVLNVKRSWLHAHNKDVITPKQVRQFRTLVRRRLNREPVAYIIGTKEFYGREFSVTPDVLIPRPETEELVGLALVELEGRKMKEGGEANQVAESYRVLDVGCGSGCIGITLKLEQPELDVTLCDISEKALKTARENTKRLGADVTFVESDLLSSFILHPSSFSVIIANLPYVDRSWETSPETVFEPEIALYANREGLELIDKLIRQAPKLLARGGYLLLEADPEQHARITETAHQHGFQRREVKGYALSFELQASL